MFLCYGHVSASFTYYIRELFKCFVPFENISLIFRDNTGEGI